MRISTTQLVASSAHPKLSLITPTLTTEKTKIGNQGTSTKTPDIAPCTNLYRDAPSGQPGKAVLSSSRNTPRKLLQGDGVKLLRVGTLERHPHTSQAFVPMGSTSETAYIVIVADDKKDGTPDLSSIKAYAMKGDEGICYAAGVWHAPMAVINQVCSNGGIRTDGRHWISQSFNT